MRKLFVLLLACLFITGTASAVLADDSSYEYLLSTPTTWRITGGTLSNGAKYAVDSSSPETFALYMGHGWSKGNMYVIGDGVFEKESCPYVKAKFEGMTDYARVIFGTSNRPSDSNLGGAYKSTAANTYSASFGTTVHDVTSASLQIIDSSTITYTQTGPFVENDETVYTATLTLTRVTDGKSITEVNGLWRIAEGTLDGSVKYVDEDSLPFNLSVSSFFDSDPYRNYALDVYGLGAFVDYEAGSVYVKANFEGVPQPAMVIWGTVEKYIPINTVTGLYHLQEDGTYLAGFSSVSYADKAGFEIVDSSTIRYWQEGPFVKGSPENHKAELILKRVEGPTFNFAGLAGTWYASNETATAASGDLSAKMTLSAKHTNTISFKNISVSGDTATLESVSDIYMDIAGYASEWEEDFGGYKPYESGVLEFQNEGGDTWRMSRTRHNDKPTSTMITIISENKLRVQRYDDYGTEFDVKYTLTREAPQPQYETTRWEIFDGMLNVEYGNSLIGFSSNNDGHSFKINGDFPANLTIHLPANWELDVDDGAKVTVSDTSKVKEAKDVDGLESPAVKIIGSNDITLNESGIIMTAWYTASTPSAKIETRKWIRQNGKLIVETWSDSSTPNRYEFSALEGTNGDGFKLTGFPSGLKINLPDKWAVDIDTSYNVTVSDESKIIPHTEIPGLPETAHRIMGSNTITLNASDIEMTAFIFTAPTITTDSNIGSYKAGDTISAQIEAEATKWTLKFTAENLPEGLNMTSDGLISGKIKTAGTYKFTVKAENCAGTNSREFTLRITSGNSETLKITTTSLTEATEGQSYSFQLTADGTNLTWSAKTKLPDNLTLSQSGLISGTPTSAGTYRVIFTVKNSSGAADNATLTLKVKSSSSSSLQKPRVKTSKLPDAFIGEEYSYQLEAEGTVDTWKIADGSTLPGGLGLNESNGEISGTVTESSAKTFRVKVIAVNEAGESNAQTVTIKVVAKTPYFKTEALKSATWSKSYSFTVRLGNMKAETWSIEGDLPEGMKFEKGKFSGKPKEVGDFDLTITASNGATEITQDFTLKVASIPPKFSGSFKTGTEGKYYECKLKAKGSTPIEWDFDSLPDGLTATPNDTGEICIISGTPTEVFAQSVAITLTNEGDPLTTHKKLTIKAVKPKFETKAKDIPGGTVGETYSYQLALKANYTPSSVKWTYTGDMPAGLYLDEDNGTIYGVPEKTVKNSRFKVSAVNAAKESLKATLNITMTIKEAEDTRLPVVGENPEGETESTTPEFVNGIAYYERGEITAENLANISNSGEVIVAILPAVEVDTEDLYEFTVSVDKSAPEGGVLVWHSFLDGEYYAGDSEEAYFLDSNNNDIKTVPEDYCVTVHAWLKPGVIYEPVIAVKISHND